MWISVNPIREREEIIQSAMALSGWYEQGWSKCGEYIHEIPEPQELDAVVIANLYNNADVLGVDIYTVKTPQMQSQPTALDK